jgi:hypothetical protein
MKILLVIPALLLAHHALFADYTFNVPVNLQDYQQPSTYVGSSQSIYCIVIVGTTEIGTGRTPISIPASGNFNATVTVAVTMRSGHAASEATDYRCYFTVADGVTAASAVSSGQLHPRAGTTPVLLVSGHITH